MQSAERQSEKTNTIRDTALNRNTLPDTNTNAVNIVTL